MPDQRNVSTMEKLKGNSTKVMREPDLHQDIEALKRDLSSLRTELGNLFRDSVETGRITAEDAADRAKESVKAKARETDARARESIDRMEDKVRERPLTSVALAMAAGMIMGALFLRSRD